MEKSKLLINLESIKSVFNDLEPYTIVEVLNKFFLTLNNGSLTSIVSELNDEGTKFRIKFTFTDESTLYSDWLDLYVETSILETALQNMQQQVDTKLQEVDTKMESVDSILNAKQDKLYSHTIFINRNPTTGHNFNLFLVLNIINTNNSPFISINEIYDSIGEEQKYIICNGGKRQNEGFGGYIVNCRTIFQNSKKSIYCLFSDITFGYITDDDTFSRFEDDVRELI